MSDEERPGVTLEQLPDEMARSTTSDASFRPGRGPVPQLVWILLATCPKSLNPGPEPAATAAGYNLWLGAGPSEDNP